ncbi:MAG: SgcJ/EcaC family oxidoreductase [Patescibacteria group bacterium]|jgi:uncharacterized protein (TIGR02246 family)
MIEKENVNEQNMEQIAKDNFKKWNESLLLKNAKNVAAHYTDGNTFLPTVSGDFKRGKTGAEEYFKHFIEKDPEGEIVEEKIDVISSDCYVHSGKYNFTVGPEDQREVVEAEFTYVWVRNKEGEWEIDHHHSSKKNDEKKEKLESGFKPDATLSGEPKEGDEEAFFSKYFKENNIGTIVEKENAVQKLSDDSYLHSGMYNTEEGDNARFTITWKKSGEEWEIIQHHLSMRPESK